MKKIMILFVGISLFARENPFFLPHEQVAPIPPSSQQYLATQTEQQTRSNETNTTSIASKKWTKKITLPFMRLFFAADSFLIQTSDPVQKHFLLDHPKKFVIDYAKKRDFGYKKYTLHFNNFSQVEIASHPSYYRVAVRLHGCDRFDVNLSQQTLLFRCK